MDLWFRNNEAFSFTTQFGQPQNFLFLVFFGNIFSSKFPITLPNDPSYCIHVFYKGRLQKKSFTVAKKLQPTLIIIISLTKKNQQSKFGMKVLYQVDFMILGLDLPNNA